MEKRGLYEALRTTGVKEASQVYWGDEMRVGLRATVRRVWAPRGVKVVQEVAFQRQWLY